jgi:hypothetical protein
VNTGNTNILFSEQQNITKWYIWIVPVLIMVVTVYITLTQLLLKQVGDTDAIPGNILIMMIVIPCILIFFLRHIRMNMEITSNGILYDVRPFREGYILWSEVKEVKLIPYTRMGLGLGAGAHGKTYNISGTHGLQLTKKNGQKILLGTDKPELLKKVLERLRKM